MLFQKPNKRSIGKLIKKVVLNLLLILNFTGLWAQNPAHFILGEEDLAGVEIYGLIQDTEKNYWIASDNGIIKFDGYEFKRIYSEGLLGNSVFEFRLANGRPLL